MSFHYHRGCRTAVALERSQNSHAQPNAHGTL
jgi:hypothetical protein